MTSSTFLFIGTSTKSGSRGIYVTRFDPDTGLASLPELAAAADQPGFLALHPDGRHLYSIGDTLQPGEAAGCLCAYEIDPATGRLRLINRQQTGTKYPVHVSVSRDGRTALTASYSGAAATTLPIGHDGALGPHREVLSFAGSSVHPERQQRSYPHSLNLDPDNRFAFVCDLGADVLVRLRFDPKTGTLSRSGESVPASARGAGPRHMAFHPTGLCAFVVNELDNTVAVYRYLADSGELTLVQSIPTLPAGCTAPHTAAEVRVHPNAQWLYVTNRGHDEGRQDGVVLYEIDPESGRISYCDRTPTGRHPRHFTIDPTGRWLVVSARESNRVETYAIDPHSGRLSPHGKPLELAEPLNLQFCQT